MRVCLVTAELASVGVSGGIGTAMEELALLLVSRGDQVEILYCGPARDEEYRVQARARFDSLRISLRFLNPAQYVTSPNGVAERSYAICRDLLERDGKYDVIHFHDYNGLGLFTTKAKRQGLGFRDTVTVVQLHGPTEWTHEQNNRLPGDRNWLKTYHAEREAIAHADYVVSPSRYLLDWLEAHSFAMPPAAHRRVIPNIFGQTEVGTLPKTGQPGERVMIDEIVMFGAQDTRKGFVEFTRAVSAAKETIARYGAKVTYVGRFAHVGYQHSIAWLADQAKDWGFELEIVPNPDRAKALRVISEKRTASVFVPSPAENSPYTVLEMVALGKPLVCSSGGGGPELIDARFHGDVTVDISVATLASKIESVLVDGLVVPAISDAVSSAPAAWTAFHDEIAAARSTQDSPITAPDVQGVSPRVTFAITHFERPRKLVDAVRSAASQTYPDVEIVVVDDGSRDPQTLECLNEIERLVKHFDGRIVRGPNRYLGAARNLAVSSSESDYIVFLDDDDFASPDLVTTLVDAAEHTSADVVNCLNLYMNVEHRADAVVGDVSFDKAVSYVPMGGPVALAPLENIYGGATALIRRKAFEAVGGYRELVGVGFEDWELFLTLDSAGYGFDVVPAPLYYYEVGRPSMMSSTLARANYRRIAEAVDFRNVGDRFADLVKIQIGEAAETMEASNARHAAIARGTAQLEERIARRTALIPLLEVLREYCEDVGSEPVLAAVDRALREARQADPAYRMRVRRRAKERRTAAQAAQQARKRVLRFDVRRLSRIAVSTSARRLRRLSAALGRRLAPPRIASTPVVEVPRVPVMTVVPRPRSVRELRSNDLLTIRALVALYMGDHTTAAGLMAEAIERDEVDAAEVQDLLARYIADGDTRCDAARRLDKAVGTWTGHHGELPEIVALRTALSGAPALQVS